MDVIDLSDNKISVIQAYQGQREKGCYSEIFKRYKDPATRYAFAVLEEKITAGEMIQLDAFRHVQDLRRIDEDDSFDYVYDLDKCRAILNFAKICPDVNLGKPLPLMLWQQAFLCKAQGWRDRHGEKRFSRFIMSVARTNGKTYMTNILISYCFLIESEGLFNQDLGYIAPVVVQSRKGFNYLKTTFNYLKDLPAFKKLFKTRDVNIIDDSISSKKFQTRISRLSHESGKLDSFHFRLLISDEAGDDKSIAKIKENNGKVTSGQVQTPDHQFGQISTAYPDSNSYLYQDEHMLKETMQHDSERLLDDYLCMVWEQDDVAETQQPDSWIKSNPVLGLNKDKYQSMMKSLISERDTFMAEGKLVDFQNKNLNMWLQTKQNTYLELDDINNAVLKEEPFDIKGRKVYIGFDKSNFSDDTALVFMFPYGDNNWYIYQHSWIPLARSQNNITIKERQDKINYREAEQLGYATIAKNEYGFIDDDSIYHWLLDFVADNELDVQYFCYDAWNASRIVLAIDQKTEWNTMPIRQGTQSLNEPTADFRKQMATSHIFYLDDPIIKYSLKNAILLNDNNGIKVDKDKATAKIDVVDAIIDAHYMAMYEFDDIDKQKDNKSVFGNWDNNRINDYFKNDFSF
ncbi:terminase TerL endonuclease subunit [Paucilactobacillus sp. N302-9]